MKTHFSPRLLWALVFGIQMLLGWIFSVIQPLGRTPDEIAHVQYIAFLAQEARLPLFQTLGGGEAGYQAQHPPLYYAFGAIFYAVSRGMEEAARWHLLRWVTLFFVGGATFWATKNFFQTLWPAHPLRAVAATASVVWMPLSLLYVGYVNPDGVVALWGAIVLWLCAKAFQSASFSLRNAAVLGFVCGLALLTKLTGLPLLFVALWTIWRRDDSNKKRQFLACLGAATLLAAPWYARNWLLYGSPFVHTLGKYGTGFENAARDGFGTFAWLTWRETFLSTWIQRGWLSDGFWSWLLYGFVGLSVVGAIFLWFFARYSRKNTTPDAQRNTQNAILRTGAALIALIFLGQQWAFWTQDVEFNAGGRYMLASLPAIAALLFNGWFSVPKVGKFWAVFWLSAILTMNLVSARHIVDVLNPRYAPGWKMFEFPPGEERKFSF